MTEVITPVVKIALPGKSMVSTNLQDFSFHSSYSSIKIFKKGTGTITVPASSNATVSITHNVGFYPLALLFVELTPGSGRWYAAPFEDVSGEDTRIGGNFDDSGMGSGSGGFKIYNKTASQKVVSYRYYIIGHSGK